MLTKDQIANCTERDKASIRACLHCLVILFAERDEAIGMVSLLAEKIKAADVVVDAAEMYLSVSRKEIADLQTLNARLRKL